MSVFDVVVVILYGSIGWWVAHPSDDRLRVRGERFARQHLAFVDSEFVPTFDRITRWSHLVSGIGFVILGVGFTAIHVLSPHADPFPVLPVVIVGVACTAWAVVRLRIAGSEFPLSPGRSGLARPRRVSLSDYVPRSVQVVTWIALVVVAEVTFDLAGPVQPWEDPLAVRIATIAAVIFLVAAGCWVFAAGRAMCERPQPAIDPCHLYFQDAWRSEFLIGAFAFVCFGALVYLSVVGMFVDLPGWLRAIGFQTLAVVGAVYFVIFARSQRHFRDRLWPTLAAGQVLLPGESVPPRAGVAA